MDPGRPTFPMIFANTSDFFRPVPWSRKVVILRCEHKAQKQLLLGKSGLYKPDGLTPACFYGSLNAQVSKSRHHPWASGFITHAVILP